MTLMRLSNIANYLAFELDLKTAVQHVALNGCKSGEPSRFYLARLNSDLTLDHIVSFGFTEEFLQANNEFSLLNNPYLNRAIHSNSISIKLRDAKFLEEFSEIATLEDSARWKSTVFLPLLPNYVATFSTQVIIEDSEENQEYFEMLRSLMALYLHSPDIQAATQTQRPTKVRDSEVGKKLTERQELILSMIKNGMTNNAIANRMGYSESLIRQETMSIYQKLGVDGRREIIKNDSLDENSNNENYGI